MRVTMLVTILMIVLVHLNEIVSAHWSDEGQTGNGLGKLSALDVICGKDHMTVRAEFAGPFHGIVFSKGTYGQDNCVYIKPYSGVTHATFKVYYDQCGTKPDLQSKYYENTVVIQYGTDIIEAWDEAKRLRCEWFEAYEKPATFRPAIPVADLDVVEMNFQGDDIDCWMEIQEGKGPWGREVSRIVPVGQPMTIVIAINDYGGEFDMRVKSCFAHDGVKPPIQMTDEHGCVLRPKMLTKFEKVKDPNGKATVISYSHFYAFKFPDSMNVQIQCTVEVCRHGCPDACQKTPYQHKPDKQFKQQVSFSYTQRSSQPALQSSSSHHHVAPVQKESTNVQDLHGLASSDSSSLPSSFVSSSSPQVIPSSTPSPPAPSSSSDHGSGQQYLSKGFDSKRLAVYSKDEAKVSNSSSPSFDNNQNTGSVDLGDNNSDSNEDEAPIDEEESKFSKEGDYQAQPSNDQKVVVPQTPHHPPPSLSSPSSESSQSSSSSASEGGEDDKPVFVHDQNGPKESIFSKLANDNYDKAAELFKDLGVNVDIAKFASGFIHGIDSNNNNEQNIASLLENNKVRDIVEASGINLKESNHLIPQVQPLISKPIKDTNGGSNDEEEHLNPDELSVIAGNSEHLTSPVPTSSYPYSLLNNNGNANKQETGHQQQFKQQANEQFRETSTAGTQSQINQNGPEKGQLSGINNLNNNNNIISNHQSSSSISSLKPTNSGIKVNQHDNQNVRPDKNPEPEAPTGLNLENPVAQVVPLQLGIGPINSFVPPKFQPNLMPPQPQGGSQQHPHPLVHQQHKQKPIHHSLHPQPQPQLHPHPHPHSQPKPQLQPPHLNHHHHQQQQQRPIIIDGIQLRPQHQPHGSPHVHQQQQHPPQLNLQQRPPNLPLHRAASLLANFAGLSNLNLPFLTSIQRQDNQRNINHPPVPSGPISATSAFPHGPRSFRSKRSPSSEPIVSVKKGFQVVTSIDLDFNPNSTELPEIYEGRREEIIYGVCMPFNGLIASLVTIIAIIVFSLISSFVLIRRINKLRKEKIEFS
ncbi:myb-like protein I [Panonychus citri]|uniref:myb-like protein I n=1 Tax=Panonychus citri TaxID=50023 RepID=UPI002307CA98|nr:myb-like protein I [Panonychus citri]